MPAKPPIDAALAGFFCQVETLSEQVGTPALVGTNLTIEYQPKKSEYQPDESQKPSRLEADMLDLTLLNQVGTVGNFSAPRLAKALEISLQAVYKAIDKKRLEIQLDSDNQAYRIALEAAYKVWPEKVKNYLSKLNAQSCAHSPQKNGQAIETQAAHALADLRASNPARTPEGAAKQWHVEEHGRFHATSGKSRKRSLALYIAALGKGEIGPPPEVRAGYPWPFSASTLEKWGITYRGEGPGGLDPRYCGGVKGHFERHPHHAEFAISLILNAPHIKKTRIYEALGARFGDAAPEYGAVKAWHNRYMAENERDMLMAINPDRYKSKYQAAFGSYGANVTRYMQVLEMDTTSIDFICSDGKRYALLQIKEVYSGWTRLKLVDKESGREHGLFFMEVTKEKGLCESVRMDNGKAYVGKVLMRLFKDLGVAVIICRPFTPEQKPFVERNFLKFLHDLLEILPGHMGHNVAQAQDFRARKSFAQRMKEGEPIETGMGREELQSFIDKWCLADEGTIRTKGRHKGKCPAQTVNEWAAEHRIRRVEHIEYLDFLLSLPIEKTVRKKGITHNSYDFIASDLGDLIGARVEVRESQETPGRLAVFYNGIFVCIAKAPELEDIDQAEIAARAKSRQKAGDRVVRAVQRELKKQVKLRPVAEAILEDRLKRVGNVSALQLPDLVGTKATEAAMAAKAAEALEAEARAGHDDPPLHRELEISPEQEKAIREKLAKGKPETPKEKYIGLLYQAIVSPEDRAFMDDFEKTKEGGAIKRFYQKRFTKAT